MKINEKAPNFKANSNQGELDFYKWSGGNWCILFSHPGDFTTVCSTEIAAISRFKDEFTKRNVKLLSISKNVIETHILWEKKLKDTYNVNVDFPIISDPEMNIFRNYKMLQGKFDKKIILKTLYIIDPNKKVRLKMTYPESSNRSFLEVLRVIESLQIVDAYKSKILTTELDFEENTIINSNPNFNADNILYIAS